MSKILADQGTPTHVQPRLATLIAEIAEPMPTIQAFAANHCLLIFVKLKPFAIFREKNSFPIAVRTSSSKSDRRPLSASLSRSF